MNKNECKKHKGGVSGLENLMKELPSNQGGVGRHKCPYCAYEKGHAEGAEYERSRIARKLGKNSNDLV